MFETHSKEEEKAKLSELTEANDDWLYTKEAGVANYTEFNKR